jgi:hypothetical protein
MGYWSRLGELCYAVISCSVEFMLPYQLRKIHVGLQSLIYKSVVWALVEYIGQSQNYI